MTDEARKLTRKQQVFIDEYLLCFNGAEAARRAGYSEHSARKTASLLLANEDINGQIQARLTEKHMSADEALSRLAHMARGDIGEVLNNFGGLDLQEARQKGLTPLIKKIKQRTITKIGKEENAEDMEIHDVEFEMYDAQAALEKILRVAGKFRDNVDLTSGGQPIASPYASMTDEELLAHIKKLTNAE